jgi:hypothetical protein
VFTFDGVKGMRTAVGKAAESDEADVFIARSVGRDDGGDVAAEFEITWSFKRRAR